MSLLQERDLDETRRRLAPWLGRQFGFARDLRVTGMSAPPSTGFSNETLLVEARWTQRGAERSAQLVVRIKATAFQIFPEYDIERQYRVLRILGEGSNVPVPRVYGYEPDEAILGAPFFVMERIDGEIPADAPPYHMSGFLAEADAASRERLWWSGIASMAGIHRLEPAALGLEFLDTEGAAATALGRQLDYYERFLAWAAGAGPPPVVEAAMAWLRQRAPRGAEPSGLCWGDARLGNMIFRDFRCVAVLDWEMATIANPVQDLAWWLFFDRHHSEGCDLPRLAGLPSREETLARYREQTGIDPVDVDYYEVFAALRFSIIMIRVGQQLIRGGILPADSDFPVDNTATKLLARML